MPGQGRVEAVYFERAGAPLDAGDLAEHPVMEVDPDTRLAWPAEIGWLHLYSRRDYEADQPGAGYSMGYRAPGMLVTAYHYPVPRENNGPDRLVREVGRHRQEIVDLYGEEVFLNEIGPVMTEEMARLGFSLAGQDGRTAGILVAERQGYFAKLRWTIDDQPLQRALIEDFIEEMLALVRK